GIFEAGEQCDDGNLLNDDGCDNNCTYSACGNGVQDSDEECDDSNQASNDGCSATCKLEICGDGILQLNEQCEGGQCCDSVSCQFAVSGSACNDGSNDTDGDICNTVGVCSGTPVAVSTSGSGCSLNTLNISGNNALYFGISALLSGVAMLRNRRRQ
ncbi:MAG: DUF4215 domain-containing protein, partial [Deltaproteobacteria bacterium]|nr:DUF4215 domain-containing protein [Deltaproteobacteria bacterium]